MNICVLYLGRTGAGNIFTYQMVESLLKTGINTTVLLSAFIENKKKFYELKGKYPSLILKEVKTYRNKREFIIRSLNVFNYMRIKHYIVKGKFDWIYIPMVSIWAAILSFFLPKKVNIVTTIHDVNLHVGEENRIIERINTNLIKKSRKLITLTNSFKELIAEQYEKNIDDICWIEHANFNYYRPDNFINKNEITKKILFFGRINKYKGISVLLDAMKEIKKKNFDIRLEIVGNGVFTKEDFGKINELGYQVDVTNRWIMDEEIYKFFIDIDIVVVPYIEASQSGVVMTAYTFGKPVIVTDVGGLPDQVTPETGVVIKSGNADELANAIITMYETPSKILTLGENAYKKSITEYSWETTSKKLIDFLNK